MPTDLMDTPRDMLLRLRVTAEAGLPLADDVSEWLVEALEKYTVEGEPLERALGLAKRGQGKASVFRAATRNSCLQHAAGALGLSEDRTNTNTVARDLAEAVGRFRSAAWPRYRTQPQARLRPDGDPLRFWLLEAFRADDRVPESEKHLRRILDSK